MNPILEQTKAATLKKADPRLVPAIQKTVDAGKLVMYSDKTRKLTMQALAQAGNDPEAIGTAVAKLMGVLFNQSKKTIPMQVLVPAATILLCEGLQFMEDGGGVKVDANFLAACTKAMGSSILQLFGVTPDKMQGMIGKQGAQPAQPQAPPPQAPPGIVAGAQGAA